MDELPSAGPAAPGQFLREDIGLDAPDEGLRTDEPEEFEEAPIFDSDALRAVCRVVSDIHAQLALAYAYGLTFQRAVRAYIPLDELDILPCLSTGVLDTLDTQLPRLDALLDHLARQAARISSRPPRPSFEGPARHSRRGQEADFAEAALGDSAVRSTRPVAGDDGAS